MIVYDNGCLCNNEFSYNGCLCNNEFWYLVGLIALEINNKKIIQL